MTQSKRAVAEVCKSCARFVRPVQRSASKTDKDKTMLACPRCGNEITPLDNGIRKVA